MLKIGTTNNPDRRKEEHNRRYRKAKKFTMAKDTEFCYDWLIKLSPLNTLRYEALNKEIWTKAGLGVHIPNDRFIYTEKPKSVQIQIRKTYLIEL